MEKTPSICIVGAGFSGMCAAIQLRKQLGINSFTIFEKNSDVGGTWLVNTYPGCACDVQSHLYSYSFELNPNWSQNYSGQEEIWRYLRDVAKKYDLYSSIRFNTEIKSLAWDDFKEQWNATILDKNGLESNLVFDVVINAPGALRVPYIPDIFNKFKGPMAHSGAWDKSINVEGNKTVAVIGSGASAIQIIPKLVPKVKELHIYQRKPAYVGPRTQFEFPSVVKWIFTQFPLLMWFYHCFIFWMYEIMFGAFKVDHFLQKIAHKYMTSFRKWQLRKHPELSETLTPNYTIGCKRIVVSEEYYPAMSQPNVNVHTSHIREVTENSIITEDGKKQKIDVLILATGFRVHDYFAPMQVYGAKGLDVLQSWKDEGPRGYMGIVSSFGPNHFCILGPNTALGHNTVSFMIECQVDFIMKVIKEMMARRSHCVRLKKSVEDEYMGNMHHKMKELVWGTAKCGSWYTNERGEVTTIYPGSCVNYWYNLRKTKMDIFEFS